MAEEIIIGIKTSTTLTPIPVDAGLHDLLDYEWEVFSEREKELWEANLELFVERKPSDQDECCMDQFALAKSLQGLLGQRLQGIIQVELSWKVWNAPEEARVDVNVKDQYVHEGPYLHYPSKPFEPLKVNPNTRGATVVGSLQTYPLAVNQPLEGSLVWTVNDHAPAVPDEIGDYIEFVVTVYLLKHARKHLKEDRERDILAVESVRVLMPRARP